MRTVAVNCIITIGVATYIRNENCIYARKSPNMEMMVS